MITIEEVQRTIASILDKYELRTYTSSQSDITRDEHSATLHVTRRFDLISDDAALTPVDRFELLAGELATYLASLLKHRATIGFQLPQHKITFSEWRYAFNRQEMLDLILSRLSTLNGVDHRVVLKFNVLLAAADVIKEDADEIKRVEDFHADIKGLSTLRHPASTMFGLDLNTTTWRRDDAPSWKAQQYQLQATFTFNAAAYVPDQVLTFDDAVDLFVASTLLDTLTDLARRYTVELVLPHTNGASISPKLNVLAPNVKKHIVTATGRAARPDGSRYLVVEFTVEGS